MKYYKDLEMTQECQANELWRVKIDGDRIEYFRPNIGGQVIKLSPSQRVKDVAVTIVREKK